MTKAAASLSPAILHSVFLSIGLVITGYFLAAAVMESRREDRTITTYGTAVQAFESLPASPEARVDAESTLLLRATAEARLHANRFAESSGYTLGSIKSASQGPVVWESDTEAGSPGASTAVTLEYFLK